VVQHLVGAGYIKALCTDPREGISQQGAGICVAFQRTGRAGELLDRQGRCGKTQNAVRTGHLPTQILQRCQHVRSQGAAAMKGRGRWQVVSLGVGRQICSGLRNARVRYGEHPHVGCGHGIQGHDGVSCTNEFAGGLGTLPMARVEVLDGEHLACVPQVGQRLAHTASANQV